MGLDTVDLLIKIENHFQIRIPDREAEQMFTVKDFYEVVWKHINKSDTGNFLDKKSDVHANLELKREEVEETINKIIAEHAGLHVTDIQPHKSITSDLGLD